MQSSSCKHFEKQKTADVLLFTNEYTFGSPAFYENQLPEASSNYDSTSAIELWLSVP